MTPFQKERQQYQPRYPKVLEDIAKVTASSGEILEPKVDSLQKETLKGLFPKTYGQPLIKLKAKGGSSEVKPLKVGIVLSGGQAPGGHNVICGVCDGIMKLSPQSQLFGFKGGPAGILKDKKKLITPESAADYLNTGGFDFLGSGRTKIESIEQFQKCREVLESNHMNALVIIGGDDSNTNAALLAEYLEASGSDISVIGVPKTIDGDLKNEWCEISFGFDTAVRVYAHLVGNIERDALSAKKYYHFIRLMGRSASRLTQEVALLTHPNVTLISEELSGFKKTLAEMIDDVAQTIVSRAEKGRNYGVVLIPEGLIEFIPEARVLIDELNAILAENREYFESLKGFTEESEYINRKLSRNSSYVLSTLPIDIQRQLLMDRDPHGNVQVSRIQTEKLIIELLEGRLGELKAQGRYNGKFSHQTHFLGYEGRCAAPTNFDADYAYSLGRNAVALIRAKANGYMSVIMNLTSPRREWEAVGVPLIAMMNMEIRHGKPKPVIKKSLVRLDEKPFQRLLAGRQRWSTDDHYRYAEPIQYWGPSEVCDQVPVSLLLERGQELI